MTRQDILNLRSEAGSAGDTETVRDCNKALRGVKAAMRRIEKMVASAKKEAAR